MQTDYRQKNVKGRGILGDLGVDGILNRILKKQDWIHLAQDRDKWRAVVYTVLNFRVQQNPGN